MLPGPRAQSGTVWLGIERSPIVKKRYRSGDNIEHAEEAGSDGV